MAAVTFTGRYNLCICTGILILGIFASTAFAQDVDPLTQGSGAVRFVNPTVASGGADPPPPPSYGIPTFTSYNDSFVNYYAHLRDHEPKVTARYDPYRDAATAPKWRCDFRYNTCFLRNRAKFAPFKVTSNFAGTYQALVLDVGAAARRLNYYPGRENRPIVQHAASRVDTVGYFPAKFTNACLNMTYYWDGTGQKTLKLLQRSEETVCIYAAETGVRGHEVSHAGEWKTVHIQLDLRYGSPRFVIEFQYETGVPGTVDRQYFDWSRLGHIAIRDFSIGFGSCPHDRNDGNECDATDVPYYGERHRSGPTTRTREPNREYGRAGVIH